MPMKQKNYAQQKNNLFQFLRDIIFLTILYTQMHEPKISEDHFRMFW